MHPKESTVALFALIYWVYCILVLTAGGIEAGRYIPLDSFRIIVCITLYSSLF